nr:D-alanyl-D-alanine carboxypeptidase [Aureimonas jatrophae]
MVPIAFPKIKLLVRRLARTAGLLAVSGVVVAHAVPTHAQAADDRYAAIVIDANNGKVLFAKSADEQRYPASLTKMMTLYMLFEALETGRATLSTPMKVSAYAAGRPPSKLGMKVGSTLSVEEGIFALVTRSANDAAVVIGEYLGGTESQFAQMMTSKARQLGMSRTVFRNANGLPNTDQHTTARDMATLGIALREHFPQYYRYFSTRSFNFRGQTIGNHNRLLGRVQGVDGIKTGYINASGFNLVTSVVRGNKKLVAAVMGGRTARSRDDHMAELVKEYLPKASGQDGAPLIAAYSPSKRGPAVTRHATEVASLVPDTVPTPTRRSSSINARVAEAYGSNAAGAMNALTRSEPRTIIGRDALRAALDSQQAMPRMDVPVANALAPTGSRRSQAEAPLAMPRIASAAQAATQTPASVPSDAASSWVVQIAATPAQATALDMLSEAQRRVGQALAKAQPFTQAVGSGNQTLYRARFAGFDTKAEANAACDALKSRSYACYAIAN